MVRAKWILCLVAAAAMVVTEAGTASPASSHGQKMSPSPRVPARLRGKGFVGSQRRASLLPADVPRHGRSRVPRRAEGKARAGVEGDPVRRMKGKQEATRREMSRAMAVLEGFDKKQADTAAEGTSQTPAPHEGQENQPENSIATKPHISSPRGAPRDRFTSDAVPKDRINSQAPPAGQLSSERAKNRPDSEVNDDRFTPPAGPGSQMGNEENDNSNFGSEGDRFTPGAEQERLTPRAERQGSSYVKSKDAIPETGSKRFSPDAEDKTKFSPEGGNKNQLSTLRNRFTPEEGAGSYSGPKDNRFGPQPGTTNRLAPNEEMQNNRFGPKPAHQTAGTTRPVLKDQNQATVTPGEAGSVTPGAEGTVSTEPLWLAWYNTQPWRQEILSQYGEEARPSRAAFGL